MRPLLLTMIGLGVLGVAIGPVVNTLKSSDDEGKGILLSALVPQVFAAMLTFGLAILLVALNETIAIRRTKAALEADVRQTLEKLSAQGSPNHPPLRLVLPGGGQIEVRFHVVFPVGILEAAKSGHVRPSQAAKLLSLAATMETYQQRGNLLLQSVTVLEPTITDERQFRLNLLTLFIEPLETLRAKMIQQLREVAADFHFPEGDNYQVVGQGFSPLRS